MTVFPRVSPFLLLFNVVTAPLGSALRCARLERGGAIRGQACPRAGDPLDTPLAQRATQEHMFC